MRKLRSFQENAVQNLEIEQEFQKLMQIQGLDKATQRPKEPYPSLKQLFHNNTMTNIIGTGPNANIKAFNYLLLCNIRKVHLKQLISEHLQEEVEHLSSEDQGFSRDRKVSFNGKGAVFVNGPQYQNYALHKLRIYAFSKTTDISIIKNTPLQNDKHFLYKGNQMTSLQSKKLLSEFLKQLLPKQIPKDYKKFLKSVRYYLNRYKIAGTILEIVMRNVLFSNYDIQSALNYEEEVSDHTVCTTLCDAFAIDGLMCRDNLYEINTWCKVYSIFLKEQKIIFVEMFNDDFQSTGITNDQDQEQEKWIKQNNSPSFKQFEICQLRSQSVNLSELKSQSAKMAQSQASSSVMDKDQESEIQSSSSERNSSRNQACTPQFDEKWETNLCRDTFRSNKKPIKFDIEEKSQQESQKEPSIKSKQQKQYQEVRSKLQNFLISNSFKKRPEQMYSSITDPNTQKSNISNNSNVLDNTTKELSKKDRFHADCTPASFFQNIGIPKPKLRQSAKSSSQQQGSSIINNNISNNIYLTLGDNTQYRPVINISTSKKDPNGININLG